MPLFLIILGIYLIGFVIALSFNLWVADNRESNQFCKKMWESHFNVKNRMGLLNIALLSWICIGINIIYSINILYKILGLSMLFYKWKVPFKLSNYQELWLEDIKNYFSCKEGAKVSELTQYFEVLPFNQSDFILVILGKPENIWTSGRSILDYISSELFQKNLEDRVLVYKLKKLENKK
jgi:hypothetical protein